MQRRSALLTCVTLLGTLVGFPACVPSDPIMVAPPVCEAGATQICLCSATSKGAQSCSDDGERWLACRCDGQGAPPNTPPPTPSTPPPNTAATVTRLDNINGLPGSVLFENSAATRGVVMLHGSEGGAQVNPDAEPLARRGFSVLSLCWFGCSGRPDKILRIPLETGVDAVRWLKQRVSSGHVGLFGVSRGAEMAVLLASLLRNTDLLAAIAVHAPSDFIVGAYDPAQPNQDLYESNASGAQVLAPAWTWQGQPLYPGSSWYSGPRIEIERYVGALWLSHGVDDELWSVDRSKRLLASRQTVPSLVTQTQFWPGEKHVLSNSVIDAFIAGMTSFFEAQIKP